MNRRWIAPAAFVVAVSSLLCWAVMFLAGTDVWHAVGRPDLWGKQGPPYVDLRAFVVAFYVLPILLLAQFVMTILTQRGR
jgi:hypothetical protein